jgi:DNA primase
MIGLSIRKPESQGREPMSLPNGFLDELRARVPISTVVGRRVTWDMRKSNPGKGDFWAPCPFHQEKTASFHVDDRKGFYYCFGCHAKGDAVGFLKALDNMGFMEAVELLAREAGMTMPARDPGQVQRDDRKTRLSEVCEAAARWFRLQLASSAGEAARAYLARRGLSAATQERFGIGFVADHRRALWTHLTGAGVAPDLIIDAGLCARPDDGGTPYDRFRGRIMFPIRDARGRCIAFGGRAMAEDARAKYLNSPETEIFDKGRTLYNLGPARAVMGKQPLIVAEGYMDVIALVAAGFEGAVAPLGTAITEDQLRLIWRLSEEPVVALDGDRAGLAAGQRLADLALPLIAAGQGLRFCLLPGGQDPDDVLRAGGAGAMQKLLDQAMSMARLLWQRETSGQVLDSPERRAALDRRLRALLARIQDPSLRAHYTEEFRSLRRDLFAQDARPFRGPGPAQLRGAARGARPQAHSLPGTRATALAAAPDGVEEDLREAMILVTLFAHPDLLADFESDLARLDPVNPRHQRLLDVLLRAALRIDPDAGQLVQDGGADLQALLARPDVTILPALRAAKGDALPRLCLAEDFARLFAARARRAEVREAESDVQHLPDEGLTWRLSKAAEAVERAARTPREATEQGEDRAALSAQLDALLRGEVWKKRR